MPVLAFYCLLFGLMVLAMTLGNSRSWYACGYCGTRNGDHGKTCPFKKKDKD